MPNLDDDMECDEICSKTSYIIKKLGNVAVCMTKGDLQLVCQQLNEQIMHGLCGNGVHHKICIFIGKRM